MAHILAPSQFCSHEVLGKRLRTRALVATRMYGRNGEAWDDSIDKKSLFVLSRRPAHLRDEEPVSWFELWMKSTEKSSAKLAGRGEDPFIGNAQDDIGIFRGTSGLWAIRGVSRVYFGTSGDVPVTR